MENKKKEIAKLLLKANSVLGGKELTKDFLQVSAIKLESFGVESVRHVLDKWVERNKFMPKLSEIIIQCKSFDQHVVHDKISPSERICRYEDFDECEMSKYYCGGKNLSDDEVTRSMREIGKPICNWHMSVIISKLHPSSIEVVRVKQWLSYGQTAPKYPHKGSIGETLLKMNTSTAVPKKD